MAQHLHHAHLAAHRRAAEHGTILERAPAPDVVADLATVYSIVYVTATPTFSGPIGGYTTLNPPSTSSSAAVVGTPLQNSRSSASASAVAVVKGSPLQNSRSATSTDAPISSSATSLQPTTFLTSPIIVDSSSAISSQPTTFLTSPIIVDTSSFSTLTSASTADATSSLGQDAVAVTLTSSTPTAAAATKHETETGMSGGAKAGLAIGILLALGIIAGLVVFFFLRLRRSHNQASETDDEKNGFRGPQTLVRSRSSIRKSRFSAPRLSLRPVSQMFTVGEKQEVDRQQSIRVAPIQHTRLAKDYSDPFGDHAAAKTSNGVIPAISAADIPKPLSIKSDKAGGRDRNGSVADSSTSGSTGSPLATGGPNNIHRIHIDFIPSMDDELELRAGALVRMLHEYDDGWALCIRLDRSQQGVVPRSCLSKMPVKARAGAAATAGAGTAGGAASPSRASGASFRAPQATSLSPGRGRSQSAAPSMTMPVELEASSHMSIASSPTLPMAGQGF